MSLRPYGWSDGAPRGRYPCLVTAPENLVPIDLPSNVIELRIHGVSGTPPEDLLRTPAIRVSGSDRSGFYRSEGTVSSRAGFVEAYSWGGLTSSARSTALWLLLLPFAVINLAGWMAPDTPPDDRRHPNGGAGGAHRRFDPYARHQHLMRVSALIASLQIGAAFFLIVHRTIEQAQVPGSTLGRIVGVGAWLADQPEHTRLGLAAIGAGLIPLLLSILSRSSSHRYDAHGLAGSPDVAVDVRDPEVVNIEGSSLPEPDLDKTLEPGTSLDELWDQPVFVRGLSQIHLGAALATVSLNTLGVLALSEVSAGRWWAIAGGAVALMAAIGITVAVAAGVRAGPRSDVDVLERTVKTVRWLGVGSWLASSMLQLFIETANPAVSTVAQYAFLVIISSAIALIIGLAWNQRAAGEPAWLNSPAYLIWGFVALVSIPSGVILLVDSERSAAISIAAWLYVVVGLAVATRFMWTWQPLGNGEAAARARRLRQAVAGASESLRMGAVGIFSGAAVATAWFITKLGEDLDVSTIAPAASIGWLAVAAFVLAASRSQWPRLAIGFVLVSIAGFLMLRNSGSVSLPNLADAVSTAGEIFLRLAAFAVMTAPVLAVGWFVLRASSKRDNRRAIGALWDVANYWPRWYHPWAPPSYSEIAIPDLKNRISELSNHSRVDVLVSAHSQGAVIALPVLGRLAPSTRRRVRLLTYGCLLDQTYHELFPRYFNASTFQRLDEGISRRWRNLHRATDPLGFPVGYLATRGRSIEASHETHRIPGRLLTHSDYQYSPEYQRELDALIEAPSHPASDVDDHPGIEVL